MKTRAVLAVLVLMSVPAAAATSRDDVLENLQKCATIADNAQRLSCYDALVRPAQDALAKPPAPEEATRAPTPQEQKSWFGFDLSGLFGSSPSQQTTPQKFGADKLPETHEQEAQAASEVDSITANVTDYAFTPYGRFVVFLDNGQVWREIDGDTDKAHFAHTPTDNKVTISRGFLGSYNLAINDGSQLFKVKRVK